MWFNDLPNNHLQVTIQGMVLVLSQDEQKQLGRTLAQRGMVTRDDLVDPYYLNRRERGK